MKYINNFEMFEAKLINTKFDYDLNIGSDIQIIDDDKEHYGQAVIKKILKNEYQIQFKNNNYSVSKENVGINIHGQAQADFSKLNLIAKKPKK